MHGIGTRAERGVDDHVGTEVALRRRPGADQVGLVRGLDVCASAVRVREDGDAADPELAERAEDADRDLTAVGDEDFVEVGHDAAYSPRE